MRIKLFSQDGYKEKKNTIFSTQYRFGIVYSKSHQKRNSGFDIILKIAWGLKEYGIGVSTGRLCGVKNKC